MAAFQNFRSALNGFNREDVVHYIEYINNNHNTQINQLQTDIKALEAELNELRSKPSEEQSVTIRLEEALEKNAALILELNDLRNQLAQTANHPKTEGELEAYRRAERAERIANERVSQLFAQANGLLADATIHTSETATQIEELTNQVYTQLSLLQKVLTSGVNTLRDTAAAMYAIKPVSPDK